MDTSVLNEYAYNSILNLIIEGSIKPGERMREDIIAEQLGISRTPVREAVNQLIQNGFINYVKRKGLYCVNPSSKELLDLVELRQVIEEYCYKKCITEATANDIQELYALVDSFYAIDKEQWPVDHPMCDIAFHIKIAEITKSQRLVKYVREIETMLLIARSSLRKSEDEVRIISLSWGVHREIVKAIEAKDTHHICSLNETHIQLMRETQILPGFKSETSPALV